MGGDLLNLDELNDFINNIDIMTDFTEEIKKNERSHDIAIIGISVRLPQADNLDEFWSNLCNGCDSVRELPEDRKKDAMRYYKFDNNGKADAAFNSYAYIEEIDKFDYNFFKITPNDASLMDPGQRLFIQTAWNAIEDAGYGECGLAGSKTGIYLGYSTNITDNYCRMILDSGISDLQSSITGNLASIISGRLSYILDLKGPAINIDSACSSSLVALHTACQGIRSGDCDMAITGGVKINVYPLDTEQHKIGIESKSAKANAFDDSADGTTNGEGVVAIILKRLDKAISDRDNIYAVIKGSAVNQDGTSAGVTAPNSKAQAEVIENAWKDAGVDPETISYIEAHGTATNLGDPIEIKGITSAFNKYTNRSQFCAIGSVKTNIGHLYEAAGVAGLIKCVLALKNGEIPPSLNFKSPNRNIQFEDSPIYVNDTLKKWDTDGNPRRCGLSSFGFSGTNCHVILEEAPRLEVVGDGNLPNVFTLSAKTSTALNQLISDYCDFINKNRNLKLEDVCFTANTGRGHYAYRLAVVAENIEELLEKLTAFNNEGSENEYLFLGDNLKANIEKKDQKITEHQKTMLGRVADSKIKAYIDGGMEDRSQLAEICKLYVAGTDIDWNSLYQGICVRRVSLPVYPFEKKRCWINIPEVESTLENSLYYNVFWEKSDEAKALKNIKGTILVIKSQDSYSSDFVDLLKEQKIDVVVIEKGDSYKKLGENIYTLKGSQCEFEQVLLDLEDRPIEMVLHIASASDNEVESIEKLDNLLTTGVLSLFNLTKTLMDRKKELELIIVSNNVNSITGREHLNPHNATLMGLGRVIPLEANYLKTRFIDIDKNTKLELLASEVLSDSKYYVTALRDNERYCEVFGPCDIENYKGEEIAFKTDGAYIITGGLGGIGLTTANYFAGKAPVKLAFVNRSRMPEREVWNKILNEGTDTKTIKKIKAINSLEKKGATVELLNADISDIYEMRDVFKSIKEKYGKILGIIHGAGVALDGFLANKEEKLLKDVLLPKVQGTWILDFLCKDEPLDFFVMYSSVASLLNVPGQGAYAAANSYMDSFASYRKNNGKKAVAINWVAWKETGMAKDLGVNVDGAFKTLPSDTAIDALDIIKSSLLSRVIVGEVNFEDQMLQSYDRIPVKFSEELIKAIENSKRSTGISSKTARVLPDAVLCGRDSGIYSADEKRIAALFKYVIGFNEINVFESLFEMGGDSILLTKLHMELEKEYPGRFTVADLFAFPTVAKLADYLGVKEEKPIDARNTTQRTDDIAIIGISARFPMADDKDEFWDNVQSGRDCITQFPESRRQDIDAFANTMFQFTGVDVEYAPGGYIREIDKFDYNFFKVTPKEASYMDPNQRLFLEAAWKAIEDAGYGGGKLSGSKTGVYIGFARANMDYDRMITLTDPLALSDYIVGNLASVIPSRISFMLDLQGPSMMVDTACSSSLVALHLACKAIQNGDCDSAIAGGVKISLVPLFVKKMGKGIGIESSDGKARTFDDASEGTGWGEGTAAVLLKPLCDAVRDNDNIYAVIKGSAINQDGASSGITAPNPLAQMRVFEDAWNSSGINPENISYIEAHGTATKLGDPIEIDAIHKAFGKYTDKKQFCAIGSLKTNIGHLDNASGIASVVKAALALKNKKIPPTLNFDFPNRKINFENSPVYINDKLGNWESDTVRCCGVNAFGFSGTNCHVVMEEAPTREIAKIDLDTPCAFVLSAKNSESLNSMIKNHKKAILRDSQLSIKDICYTLQTGRGHYNHRLAFVVENTSQLLDILHKLEQKDIKENNLNGVWYFNTSSTLNGNYEITCEANDTTKSYIDTGKKDKNLIEKLCRLYSKGADVDWNSLYQGDVVFKASLPTYSFDKKRCWIDIPDVSHIAANSLNIKNPLLHTFQWIKSEPNSQTGYMTSKTENKKDTVILLSNGIGKSAEVSKEILKSDINLIDVKWGNAFEIVDKNKFIVDGSSDSFETLLRAIGDVQINGVIHMDFVDQRKEVQSFDELKERLDKGVYSLFYFIKSLMVNKRINKGFNLSIITQNHCNVTGEDEYLLPEGAALAGLGKALSREIQEINVQMVDVDSEISVASILGELNGSTTQVAYRKGVRYIPEFLSVDDKKHPENEWSVKEEGVYIITGGTGGIGLEVCKLLLSKGKVNLALINRSRMPERRLWNDILAKDEDKKLCLKLKKIIEIEKMAGEVQCISVDISDYAKTEIVINDLKAKYRKINGIIHAAGVAGDTLVAERNPKDFMNVINPKIGGTWNLDNLTRDENMDFFVVFSSVASIFTAPKQGDYSAANSYLDSFAQQRSLQGKRTLGINWVAWKETGMAADSGFTTDTIFKSLVTVDGIKAMDMALKKDLVNVMVGELNIESDMVKLIDRYPIKIADDLRDKIFKNKTGSMSPKKVQNADKKHGEIVLNGNNEGNYNKIELEIALVCNELLGFDEMSIYDNFLDLGVDSIQMVRIAERLDVLYQGKVKVTDIFENPTIFKLAKFISGQDSQNEKYESIDDKLNQMLDEMGNGNMNIDALLKNIEEL